jgi:hypothetical protein
MSQVFSFLALQTLYPIPCNYAVKHITMDLMMDAEATFIVGND